LEAAGRECFITSRDGPRAEIHSLKDWEQIEDALAKLPASAAKRRLLDATNYYGQVVRMDDQGRLLIPQLLRESATLVGDVAVMGIEKKLVVANDARLRAQITENPATDEDIESLGVVGL